MKIPLNEIADYSELTLSKGTYSFTGKVVEHSNNRFSFSITQANGNAYLLNEEYYGFWEEIVGVKKSTKLT